MTRSIFIAAALALAVTLPAVPAQAAAGRTFVSAAGSDTNPCTITMPCRNLQAAYNAVAPNGEVEALDPGNYGSLTIIGPVTIQGHGWAGMSTTTGAAITINAAGATDKINIFGVVADGLGISGTNGIVFNSGGRLNVKDSVIQNFANDGITLNATAPVSISDTVVSDNTNHGINFQPGGAADLTLERVQAIGNSNIGILIEGENAARGCRRHGHLRRLRNFRKWERILYVKGFLFLPNRQATIVNCKIVNNNVGLLLSDSTVYLAQSTISNNKTDGFSTQFGTLKSFGNNFITDTTNPGILMSIAQR